MTNGKNNPVLSWQVKTGVLSTTVPLPEIWINKITSDVLDSEADCSEYKVMAVRKIMKIYKLNTYYNNLIDIYQLPP